MLAFSTCWNNHRHSEGDEMIEEIRELGFDTVELSHGMTVAKYPGLKRSFDNQRFTCSGVHNYFPSPVEVMIDAPDAYEFTSHRPFDRKRAMDSTLKTLEVAAEFGGKYVVLHMGSVRMKPERWTKRLTAMVEAGEHESKSSKYERLLDKFVRKRAKASKVPFARAIEALEQIAEKAKEVGVPVAVESRSRYEDVPSETEMIVLQQHFTDNEFVGYWHDFGHVQLKHNLGLLHHGDWLKKMEPYLIGGHIHDVQYPARDHRVPFTGELEYEPLLRSFTPDMPLVWELSPTRRTEEIVQALEIFRLKFPAFS